MAERLKVKLLDSDKLVDLVAGPDAYRDVPRLLDTIEVMICMKLADSHKCMQVCCKTVSRQLSVEVSGLCSRLMRPFCRAEQAQAGASMRAP